MVTQMGSYLELIEPTNQAALFWIAEWTAEMQNNSIMIDTMIK